MSEEIRRAAEKKKTGSNEFVVHRRGRLRVRRATPMHAFAMPHKRAFVVEGHRTMGTSEGSAIFVAL